MSHNKQTYNFENQVAIVTGAASGIGASTAIAFAKAKAKVVLADVSVEAGEKISQLINKEGGQSFFIKADMMLEKDIQKMVQITLEKFGRLDFAFNNAGIEGIAADTENCSNENWDRVLNINLRGVWWCMKYQIPEILKAGGGAIVNCSSIAGVVGFSGMPAYVASKHGLLGLTKTAALEYATKNIRINAVCPGVIDTPMIERFAHGEAQITKALSDGEPMARMGKPEEIAQAVLWLCSEGASFVTGHPLVVDGGWVAR